MANTITLSVTLPATPQALYRAWLSSADHTAFTGSPAQVSGRIGASFTAWDGYISGKNVRLVENRRIVQSWRTTEFPAGAPDSNLEILFDKVEAGTRITIIHSEIPHGQISEYRKGWKDFYFTPMKEYFVHKK